MQNTISELCMYAIEMSVCLIIVYALSYWLKFGGLRQNDGHNLNNIEGLRGISALMVVHQHSKLFYWWFFSTEKWDYQMSRLEFQPAVIAVALFFMITGYLFWKRLIAAGGRPNWVALYCGRVCRLAPIYWVAALGFVLIVLARHEFVARVPFSELAGQVLVLFLSLGVLPLPDLDGDPLAWQVLAGVTWTLVYEWAFYAALPFMAILARDRRPALAFPAAALVVVAAWLWLTPITVGATATPVGAALLFLAGMTVAGLQANGLMLVQPDRVLSVVTAAVLLEVFLIPRCAYDAPTVLSLAIVFYAVVSGGTLFGLLRTPAACVLGRVSYDVYLLHGLVFVAPTLLPGLTGFVAARPYAFSIYSLAVMTVLALVAFWLNAWVEQPVIEWGRRLRGFGRAAGYSERPGA